VTKMETRNPPVFGVQRPRSARLSCIAGAVRPFAEPHREGCSTGGQSAPSFPRGGRFVGSVLCPNRPVANFNPGVGSENRNGRIVWCSTHKRVAARKKKRHVRVPCPDRSQRVPINPKGPGCYKNAPGMENPSLQIRFY